MSVSPSRVSSRALALGLQPWQAWLGWFDAELARSLGELVRRLADLAGPARAVSGRQATEPDGLGDLRTRGSYERLLVSEWLLADELPLEFLRRAASSEHLFLAPSLRAQPSERHVIAIFDAGPRQLGAPRVAHLAAWILLARRAEQLGGSLRWGVLQRPGVLMNADGLTSLRALLDARSLSAEDVSLRAGWREALAEAEPVPPRASAAPEVWWIGAPHPADGSAVGHERRLELTHAWSADALDAVLVLPRGRRSACLPLPVDTHLGALLRGQFSKAGPASTRAQHGPLSDRLLLTRRPLISADGVHVAAFSADGNSVLVAKQHPGGGSPFIRSQRWSGRRPLVAATLNRGQLQGLGVGEGQTVFWQVKGWRPAALLPAEDFATAVATTSLLPLVELRKDQAHRLCVLDRRERLMVWQREPGQVPVSNALDDNVLGMVPLGGDRLAYGHRYGGGLWLRELGAADGPSPLRRRICALDDPHAALLFSTAQRASATLLLGLAVRKKREGPETWALFLEEGAGGLLQSSLDAPNAGTLELPAGDRAVGVVSIGLDGRRELRLVVLDAGRRRLTLLSAANARPLFSGNGRIAQVTVCPRSGHVAVVTDDRTLHFIDGRTGDLILRLSPKAPAEHLSTHPTDPTEAPTT